MNQSITILRVSVFIRTHIITYTSNRFGFGRSYSANPYWPPARKNYLYLPKKINIKNSRVVELYQPKQTSVDLFKSHVQVIPLALFGRFELVKKSALHQYHNVIQVLKAVETDLLAKQLIVPVVAKVAKPPPAVRAMVQHVLRSALINDGVARLAAESLITNHSTNETLLDCFNGVVILIYSHQLIPITTALLDVLAKYHVKVTVIKLHSTFYRGDVLTKILQYNNTYAHKDVELSQRATVEADYHNFLDKMRSQEQPATSFSGPLVSGPRFYAQQADMAQNPRLYLHRND